MAQLIKLKRSSVAGKVPSAAQLDAGEIAINTADGRLFFERDDTTIQHIVTTNSDTTGSINIIGAITGSSLQVAGINYPTTDGTLNQAIVTDGAGNLSFGSVAAATAANTVVTVKNVSGGTIEKGTPLYVTGSGTSGNVVGVWPADAGNPLRMPALLIAGEQLLDGAEGEGLLDGYISGVDTSAFASGDEVFVAVGGGYTNVAPTGSGVLIQKLGNVEKVHPTNGSGVINGPNAARSLPNWETGKVMVGSPIYPVTSSFTYFDETNSRLGINTTVPSYALDVNAANIRVGVHTIGTAGSAVTSSLAIGQDALGSYSGTSGNTAIGWKALSLVTGGPNDAIGAEAMRYSIGATYNTAIGVAAGYRSQGTQNTFIGQFSGPYYYDLTEGFNTFIGPLVGIFSSGSARQNTGIGASALYNFRTANSNTAIGSAAGFELTTGGFNTFLGDQAGRGVTTGTRNTVIGRVAGLSPTLTKSIIIGDGDGTIRYRYDNTTDNTFISSSLTTSGFISASGLIYAPNIGAGVDNSVVILDSDGTLRTDEIDSRVWGSTLTDGSGTANYIPKWSDANTLADSIIYDSGTGIGIGTTVTSRNLDIESSAGTSVGIQLNSTATGGRSYSFFSTNNSSGIGGGKFGIYDDTAQQSRITVISDGNVGIGNTNPSAKFVVQGSAGNLYIDDLGAGYNYYDASNVHNFRNTAGVSRLFIDASGGNVGIGNTTPPQKLTVQGNISASGVVYSDTFAGTTYSGNSFLSFNDDQTLQTNMTTLASIARINFMADTNNNDGASARMFTWYANTADVDTATELMYLNKDGALNLDGNLTVTGIVTAQEFHTEFVSASIVYSSGSTKFGDSADDIHQFTGSVQVSGSARATIDGNGNYIELGASDGFPALKTNGSVIRVMDRVEIFGRSGARYFDVRDNALLANARVDGVGDTYFAARSGSVGIGTTTPPQKLTVEGNISGSGRLYVGTVDNAATDTDKFLVLNGQEVEYRTGAQVLSDIGAQAAGSYVTDAGGAAGQVGVWSSATAMSGSNQLYWDGSKLGVNTASPSTTLDVVGAGTTSVDLAHFANSNQTAKILLSLDGVGSSLISMLDASNNEDIRLSTQGSSWFNAGNVGINTASPSERLHVSGGVLIEQGTLTISDDLQKGGSGRARIKFKEDIVNDSMDIYYDGDFLTGDNNYLAISSSKAGVGNVLVATVGGDVGIRTSSTTQTLDVTGVARFRGGTARNLGSGETPTDAGLIIDNNYYIYTHDAGGYLRKLIGKDSSDILHIGQGGTNLIDEIRLQPGFEGPVTFYSASAEYARFAGGNLMIGNTSAAARIDVREDSGYAFRAEDGTGHYFRVQAGGNVEMRGNLTVGGIVTAQEFHTEFVSASIIYQSGSTKFGNTVDDIHSFTGSLNVQGGITGSLLGTAATASYAIESAAVRSANATFNYDGYVALFSSTSTDAQILYKDIASGLRYNPSTNRLALTGSLEVTGGITGSLFGTASVALSAPNLYSTDGLLTGNRTIDADGNNITFVVDTGNDFTISSDPAGTVAIDGLTSGTRSHLVGIDTGNGKLYTMTTSSIQNVVSASYAATASIANSATYSATASYGAANFTTAGDVYINGNTEIYGYASVESLNLVAPNSDGFSTTMASASVVPNGSTVTMFTINSAGYEAAFLDYVVFDSARTNKRTGNFRINWDLTANAVTYDETSTKDIGDTTGFIMFAEVVGSVLYMKAENNTGQNMQIVYERKLLYVV